jgi:hypothetical protein
MNATRCANETAPADEGGLALEAAAAAAAAAALL